MSIRYAFVTLLTSDDYLLGALTVAAALKDVHRLLPSDQTVGYETVCLVTPETVDVTSIRMLRKAFNVVVGVEIIVPPDTESLNLLGRPDLDTALTKLHVFRLTQYSKVIFLDADVLPLRPLSHLFLLDHEFSAVPDVGWPDIFNSGVMVLSPGEDKFKVLRELLNTKGTWDGADQGLLNEWRGSDWNRLSFTYNTTPTAIYTYAPAYQRFGSQISVIHFIGPHKPWHSIAYRAPGSSVRSTNMILESSTEFPATQKHAYDYGSLVDHWYKVYDQHYRSQVAEPVFQPTRYTSAWNEAHHDVVTGGAFGLEELRRAAIEGIRASGFSTPRADGEGEYRTMPLEGRFDLIHPRTRAERRQMEVQREGTETSESTLAPAAPSTTTPEPTTPEPSTPPGQVLSLPSGSPVRWTTLPTPGVNEIPPAPHTRLISLPHTPLRHVPAPYKSRRDTRESGSQTTPIQSQRGLGGEDLPLTPLMDAVETPPNVVTPIPADTYFPKAWDIDQNWSSLSPASSETSLTTMEPSPSKPQSDSNALFTSPHRSGQYHKTIGEEKGSSTPDPTKVKRVFPWEDRPRPIPGRVFPDQGSPSTVRSHLPVPATPERKATFRSPMPSPLFGFPPSLRSHHPSEGPLSQRRTGNVPRSIFSFSPLGLESEPGGVETSSQDGDVEDEADSEEEAVMRSRTRSSTTGTIEGTPKYRSIGVQTDPRDAREEGVQVTTFVPVTEVAEKLRLMNRRSRRSWSTSTGNTGPLSGGTHLPLPLDSQASPLPSSSPDRRGPAMLASDETGNSSPSSTSSCTSAASPFSQTRKGSRVWDPARGVDTFKRGSEEVLSKFMKMGSLDERA